MNIININTPFVLLKNRKRLLKILNTLKLNFLLLHVGTLTYVTKTAPCYGQLYPPNSIDPMTCIETKHGLL